MTRLQVCDQDRIIEVFHLIFLYIVILPLATFDLSIITLELPIPSRVTPLGCLSSQMRPEIPRSRVLDAVYSSKPSNLLDFVDALRSQVIKQDEKADESVSLPQIIVCGDQCSGKTSVLEAISGVPLPIRGNRGVQFSTELILRKTSHIRASVTIIPDYAKKDATKKELAGVHKELDSFDSLSDLIINAKCAIVAANPRTVVSKDFLRIAISGPGQPDLTLLNTPGSGYFLDSEDVEESDARSVSEVEVDIPTLKSSMDQSRSIIMPIVSAHSDFDNQRTLKLARSVDSRGKRTLGVITKPDTLVRKSESESQYHNLALNKSSRYRHDWHVLKNLDSKISSEPLATRNERETEYFQSGIWKVLPDSSLGVDQLRTRLSKMLLDTVKAGLPELINEIEELRNTCQSSLEDLGEPRTTLQQQQRYLLEVVQSFQRLVKSGINGDFSDDFFKLDMSDSFGHHIRAIVQRLNEGFANTLSSQKRSQEVVDDNDVFNNAPHRGHLTRDELIEEIEEIIGTSRGRQLPGLIQPIVFVDVFEVQTIFWERLADLHVREVWDACEIFLLRVVEYVADGGPREAIMSLIVEPAIKSIKIKMNAKTKEILAAHQNIHQVTHSDDFENIHQDLAKKRERTRVTKTLCRFFGVEDFETTISDTTRAKRKQSIDDLFKALVDDGPEPPVHQISAPETLDQMNEYYKVCSIPMHYKRHWHELIVLFLCLGCREEVFGQYRGRGHRDSAHGCSSRHTNSTQGV